jgi:type IV secretory pathway TrbL component
MNEKKIDFLGPLFIMAIISTLMSDITLVFGLLFILIPVLGIVLFAIILLFHYFVGLILLFLILPKLKHLIPKIILVLAILIPLPFLTLSVVIAIILQNRFVELIVTQAAIAIATGGVGTVVSAGAAAARVGAIAARGAETATAARTGAAGARTARGVETAGAENAERQGIRAGAKNTPELQGKAAAKNTPKTNQPQQEPAFKDKIKTQEEKLNKILDKIHEQEGPDEEENEEIAEEKI